METREELKPELDLSEKNYTLLARAAENSGFGTIMDLLEDTMRDSVVDGICTVAGCDGGARVEGDQDHGWCESCGSQSVVSPLRLAGLI